MAKSIAQKQQTLAVPVTILGIDSNYEPATLAAYQYREKHVYLYIMSKGYAVDKCQGPMAKRIYVAPKAQQPGIAYLTGVGHGSCTAYTGHYYDPIFQVGNYSAAEANGRIAHFLSCETARDLGPDFVRNGCLAYFGYDEDFVFTTADQDIFFECDSEIDRAFADGLTAAQVYDRVKALFVQRAADFRAQGKQTEAATLESDLDCMRVPRLLLARMPGETRRPNCRDPEHARASVPRERPTVLRAHCQLLAEIKPVKLSQKAIGLPIHRCPRTA